MRIDAHQHFWDYDPDDYAWIGDSMAIIRRDFRPADLKPLLDSEEMDGSVLVQVRQSLEETEYLLGLAEEHAFIRGVVGWVDLANDAVHRQLEQFRSHPRFVGVRHVVQDEPDERFLLRDDFCAGIALLAELCFDILIYPNQLPAAIEFVNRFPGQRLVLDHLAKPYIARGELEPWASQIRELAKAEHVFCKLSGMVTEADWEKWQPADFRPYLDVVFEAFGPQRLMIGSDWPVCTLAADYGQVIDIVRNYVAALPAQEQAAIFGGNAAAFYRLRPLD